MHRRPLRKLCHKSHAAAGADGRCRAQESGPASCQDQRRHRRTDTAAVTHRLLLCAALLPRDNDRPQRQNRKSRQIQISQHTNQRSCPGRAGQRRHSPAPVLTVRLKETDNNQHNDQIQIEEKAFGPQILKHLQISRRTGQIKEHHTGRQPSGTSSRHGVAKPQPGHLQKNLEYDRRSRLIPEKRKNHRKTGHIEPGATVCSRPGKTVRRHHRHVEVLHPAQEVLHTAPGGLLQFCVRPGTLHTHKKPQRKQPRNHDFLHDPAGERFPRIPSPDPAGDGPDQPVCRSRSQHGRKAKYRPQSLVHLRHAVRKIAYTDIIPRKNEEYDTQHRKDHPQHIAKPCFPINHNQVILLKRPARSPAPDLQ